MAISWQLQQRQAPQPQQQLAQLPPLLKYAISGNRAGAPSADSDLALPQALSNHGMAIFTLSRKKES